MNYAVLIILLYFISSKLVVSLLQLEPTRLTSVENDTGDHNSNYLRINNSNLGHMESHANTSPKLICFYEFTSDFNPEIMLELCTHINVGFFKIDNKSNCIENSTNKLQQLQKLALLKNVNKELKILVVVGGEGFQGFSSMVNHHSTRKIFIRSVIVLLKKFKLDGLDLDWEWPVLNGNAIEKIKFIQLLQEVKEEFGRHKKTYILSADVSSLQTISDLAYKIPYMAQYVDFVNVMCYDYFFYTKLYPLTGHNAPLYTSSDNSVLHMYSINYSINYWILNSMPKNKIVLGVPTYGHTYMLSSPQLVHIKAPAKGFGTIGKNGFANYPEICQFITANNATVIFDNKSKVPYTYKFPNWISYENEQSIIYKANYAMENQLAGTMIYSVNSDDYSGVCHGNVALPLIRKVRSILFNEV